MIGTRKNYVKLNTLVIKLSFTIYESKKNEVSSRRELQNSLDVMSSKRLKSIWSMTTSKVLERI